ncbi:MAG: GNAT family N-acetyltransferase, partial [Calditrichaeota bacterium]|nr:GNAT family N-acetyltransferase [Calditrichota bacterium]
MKYKIREATEIDIPSIMKLVEGLAIYEKLEHEMVATADDFAKFGFGENRYFHALLAADESGEDVGFALYFFTFSTFLAKPTLFLEDLFVMPDHRGNGIGIALLSELAKIAIEKDC